MGSKLSVFNICKGTSKNPQSETPPESPTTANKREGPAKDKIFTPGGYNYFSEQEEKHYEQLLVQEAKSTNEIHPPQNWQSSEVIGQGSFGRVLFAANMDTGELMAAKQIPIVGFAYETAHERIKEIQEEVEILSQLNHKNIVRYLGTQRDDQYLHIFLEYVAGGSIASLLAKYGKFNETLIRVYTQQILEGLEYLHYHKIIHRDIKGANVLVGNDGVCKLADFGSAKRIIGIGDNTQFKSMRGTINWMAPEIMKQEGYGRFADIWSLGCLVVEMATGKPPWYHKTNPIAVFMHVCNTEVLPELPHDLSEDAKDFILKCFNRNPSERPNVCKLLKHRFISGVAPIPMIIEPDTGEEVFNSTSTKFTSDTKVPKILCTYSTYQEDSKSPEEVKVSHYERQSEEPNYEELDPSHNLKGPFGNIITTSMYSREQESPQAEMVLRRPSTSESDASNDCNSDISSVNFNMRLPTATQT